MGDYATRLVNTNRQVKPAELSDHDVEQWFWRHKLELETTTVADVVCVAPWLPIVGPAANNNISGQGRFDIKAADGRRIER